MSNGEDVTDVCNHSFSSTPFGLTTTAGMVIDEAQKIKNHGALVSRAVKEVGNAIGHTRIALSGAGFMVGWFERGGGLFLVWNVTCIQ